MILELRRKWIVYLCSAAAGTAVFLFLFGVEVLDPHNINWLLGEKADLTQHYLGWKAYCTGSWRLPLGCVDNLAYPVETSVIFTDSIPIFAVAGKVLASVFHPDLFQYFGLYGLLCFILQGVFAAVILKKYLDHDIQIILGSIFIILTPVMIDSMYYQTSLASHWILMLVLLLPVYYDEFAENRKKQLILTAVSALLVSGIHIYLMAMCGIILCAYGIIDIAKSRQIKNTVSVIITFVGVAALHIWILGGFNGAFGAARGGLGMYSLNLNSFINPQGWSRFFKTLPTVADTNAREGFAYLGMGAFLLLIFSMCSILYKRYGKKERICSDRIKWTVAGLALAGVFLIGLSPVVMCGDKVLFEIPYPEIILKCWGVFRATGRFGWLIIYPVLFFAIAGGRGCRRSYTAVLTLCLCIQIIDIYPGLMEKKEKTEECGEYTSPLEDPIWRVFGETEEIKHVYFCFADADYENVIFPVTDWALEYGKSVNRFYFARTLDKEQVAERLSDALWEKPADSIFVFRQTEREECFANNMNYYETEEGLILGYAGKLEGYEPDDISR